MKNYTFIYLLLFSYFSVNAQQLASTNPEKRKVILEEYTGINCGFCPSGHQIAEDIKNSNPDDVFIINIHAGFTSVPDPGQPDFRTDYGWPLVDNADTNSFPSGSVNRFKPTNVNNYPGHGIGRFYWEDAADDILALDSYVNVGVEAFINKNTRVLTINSEVYYTNDSPSNTNKLNIVLLQDNTLGPQSGGGQGDNYNHRHRMVHMITGQWGENISSTRQGDLVTNSHTYTVPTDYKGVDVDLDELEIIVFVTEEDRNFVVSGNGTQVIESNLSTNTVEASLFSITPNPTNNGIIQVTTDSLNDVSIEIYDLLGHKVLNEKTFAKNTTLNLSSLNSGLYMVKYQDQNNRIASKKLIIK